MAEAEKSKQKRRLRPATESLRDKRNKAQEVAAKPNKKRPLQKILSGVLLPFKLLFKLLASIGHLTPLRQIGHGLRWFFSLKPFRVLAIILGFRFVRSSWREVRQVSWPSFRMSMRLTGAVIVFSFVFGILIAIVDFALNKGFKELLLK